MREWVTAYKMTSFSLNADIPSHKTIPGLLRSRLLDESSWVYNRLLSGLQWLNLPSNVDRTLSTPSILSQSPRPHGLSPILAHAHHPPSQMSAINLYLYLHYGGTWPLTIMASATSIVAILKAPRPSWRFPVPLWMFLRESLSIKPTATSLFRRSYAE